MRDVLGAHDWRTNGHMIEDVARLGYLDGRVLDATLGESTFWNEWKPEYLATNDLYKPALYNHDFRYFPENWAGFWDSVVFDPPYKLSGTPSLGQFDQRYGIDRPMKVQDRLKLILDGAVECWRITKGFLLVKCQDQVVSGNVVWQTSLIKDTLSWHDARLVDRFDFIYTPRPQPVARQVHARRNTSQLLVFSR